jgi:hypothetical protein
VGEHDARTTPFVYMKLTKASIKIPSLLNGGLFLRSIVLLESLQSVSITLTVRLKRLVIQPLGLGDYEEPRFLGLNALP